MTAGRLLCGLVGVIQLDKDVAQIKIAILLGDLAHLLGLGGLGEDRIHGGVTVLRWICGGRGICGLLCRRCRRGRGSFRRLGDLCRFFLLHFLIDVARDKQTRAVIGIKLGQRHGGKLVLGGLFRRRGLGHLYGSRRRARLLLVVNGHLLCRHTADFFVHRRLVACGLGVLFTHARIALGTQRTAHTVAVPQVLGRHAEEVEERRGKQTDRNDQRARDIEVDHHKVAQLTAEQTAARHLGAVVDQILGGKIADRHIKLRQAHHVNGGTEQQHEQKRHHDLGDRHTAIDVFLPKERQIEQ